MVADMFSSTVEDFTDPHIDFDAHDDVCMSDVDDLDAFDAVFPQAPLLAKHHELRPLVDALRSLIARPEGLVCALVSSDGNNQATTRDYGSLITTTHTYTKTYLDSMVSFDGYMALISIARGRQTLDDDRWACPHLQRQVDEMMIKLTLYFIRLWDLICVVVVDAVYQSNIVVQEISTAWSSRSDSIPMMTLLEDPTQLFRPLRLRSAACSTESGSPARRPPLQEDPASRRSRLARKSNEFMVAWFLHHKSNPYPSATERVQIAEKTGLSEQQVRNWFANMRKRHWKPRDDKKSKKPRCLLDMLLRKSDPMTAKVNG